MTIEPRTATEVTARSVAAAGLDAGLFDLASPEAVAEFLRLAAGALAPCPTGTLRAAVLRGLRAHLDPDDADELVEDTLEALLAYGDLHEHPVAEAPGRNRTLVFAAPPSFVRRDNGRVFLVGVPSGPLPAEVEREVVRTGAARSTPAAATDEFLAVLEAADFRPLPGDRWLRAPEPEDAARHVARYDDALGAVTNPAGAVEGLIVLDPSAPVHYYRGRWRQPAKRTGRFVGRRPQRYGADRWCYVELDGGRPVRLLDLPVEPDRRGADDAWRLQAALDATLNHPQRYRRRPVKTGVVLDLFGPVPSWALRRWSVFGEPMPRSDGSLLGFRFAPGEVDEEVRFAHEHLWLAPDER